MTSFSAYLLVLSLVIPSSSLLVLYMVANLSSFFVIRHIQLSSGLFGWAISMVMITLLATLVKPVISIDDLKYLLVFPYLVVIASLRFEVQQLAFVASFILILFVAVVELFSPAFVQGFFRGNLNLIHEGRNSSLFLFPGDFGHAGIILGALMMTRLVGGVFFLQAVRLLLTVVAFSFVFFAQTRLALGQLVIFLGLLAIFTGHRHIVLVLLGCGLMYAVAWMVLNSESYFIRGISDEASFMDVVLANKRMLEIAEFLDYQKVSFLGVDASQRNFESYESSLVGLWVKTGVFGSAVFFLVPIIVLFVSRPSRGAVFDETVLWCLIVSLVSVSLFGAPFERPKLQLLAGLAIGFWWKCRMYKQYR